jgi:hypothetical protein
VPVKPRLVFRPAAAARWVHRLAYVSQQSIPSRPANPYDRKRVAFRDTPVHQPMWRALIRDPLTAPVPVGGGQLGQRWYVHDRRPLRRLRPNPYEIGVLL